MTATSALEDHNNIRRVADYEQISGILWIVLGALQICFLITIIAGIWNVFTGISRIKLSKRIRLGEHEVVESFEPVTQLVVIGVVNLVLGAVIGVALVAFDFYIRDFVLANRRIFEGNREARDVPERTPPISPGISPARDTSSYMEEIRNLASLRDEGLITEEEFAAKKMKILD